MSAAAHFSAESMSLEAPEKEPPLFSHSDAHLTRTKPQDDQGTKRVRNGWRTVNNYISGGQGGSGGGGGLQGYGGAGGAGEGPTLRYIMKAECIVMKMFNSPETIPSDFVRIPLGNIDLRSEIRVDAAAGAVWRHRKRKKGSVRRMYSALVVGQNERMALAMYQRDNAEEVRNSYYRYLVGMGRHRARR
ncbi:hypothetical protein C8R45DRAFT_1160373 [Mycena sanguinolenta]|nr:hypothetical protein C8R45DRAFT_1160373 [Mycena sanguinolenta]